MNRYPEYAESTSDWLTELPAHWSTPALGIRYTIDLGKMLSQKVVEGDHLVPYLRNVDVQWDELNLRDLPVMNVPPRERRRYTVQAGDLLVCEGGEVGRAAIVPELDSEIAYQKALHRLRPGTGEVPRFLYYTLVWVSATGIFTAGGNPNTILHLTGEMLRRYRFPRPPTEEQHAIADFLDLETTKIDRLIEQKERLIELLEEKRTALITRAVTRGLDPDVEMTDSGVEWLGKVPSHWTVAPLYSRYEVALGKMLDSSKYTGEAARPYLRNVDVQWHAINVDDLPQMDFSGHELSRYRLAAGDVLVCEGGEVGRAALWKGELAECYYQKALHRLRPHSALESPGFFVYVMEAAANAGVYVAGANPNTIDHLTAVQLKHHKFAFPPSHEQEAIAAYLVRQDRLIRNLVKNVEHAILLLSEYRTALISAAVTGNIDVREHAA